MRLPSILIAVCFLASAASPALAKKGPPKLKQLQGLVDEIGKDKELSDDAWKAIKAADRCANSDLIWERAMEPEQQTPIDMMFEQLASGVTCWQGAEKKAAKAAEELPRLSAFVVARARYVEAMRGFYDAFRAKAVGDINQTCKRFRVAVTQAAAAVESSEGLQDKFGEVDNKTLALTIEQKSAGIAGVISSEYENQNCN